MATRTAPDVGAEIRFRTFCLAPGTRMLLRDGAPVELGSRAFDLLHVLTSARGSVVSKRAIASHVWPDTIVEESNLRFQIGMLRKALGRDRDLIKTVPGRGYLFALEAPPETAGRRGPFGASQAAYPPQISGPGQIQQARLGPGPRENSRDLLLARLAESPEVCDALRLLCVVLDEVWALTSQGEDHHAPAPRATVADTTAEHEDLVAGHKPARVSDAVR